MLRQFLKAIFKNGEWLVKPYPYYLDLYCLNLYPYHLAVTTSIYCHSCSPPPPHTHPYFVQGTGEGGRRRYFEGELGHHTILLQYFVLMAVVQLFTFCLSVDCSFSYYWNSSWTVPWWCYKGGLFCKMFSFTCAWWAGFQGSEEDKFAVWSPRCSY